ncbi:MAG: peroxiredoxin Q/BCP [Bradymonadia bacterium]|jgi:peroxiredoxin Q/BCP
MLAIGDAVPDFTIIDDAGESVRRDDLLADGPFVLYFYPADFTPVCTKQACMFRDIHPELVDAGLRVVGVSAQGASSHTAFKEKFDLPFPLLADKDKAVAKAFGVLTMGFMRRASFLIDGQGRVVDRLTADLRVQKHEDFARRAITRFGR